MNKLLENLIKIYKKDGYSGFEATKLAICTITLFYPEHADTDCPTCDAHLSINLYAEVING